MNLKKITLVVEKIGDEDIGSILRKVGGVVKVNVYSVSNLIEIEYDVHSLTEKKIVEKIENLGLKVIKYIDESIENYTIPVFRYRRRKIFFNLFISILFLLVIFYARYLDMGGITVIFMSFFILLLSGIEMYQKALFSAKNSEFDINIFSTILVLSFFVCSVVSYYFLDIDTRILSFLSMSFIIIIVFNLYEYLNSFIIDKINASFESILKLSPSFISVIREDKKFRISIDDVKKDEFVVVEKGERIPVDGILVSQFARIKQPFNNSETEVLVKKGDFVYAGGINSEGEMVIKTLGDFRSSLIYKITDITRRFYYKRKEIKINHRNVLYYFYFVVITTLFIIFYHYFKGDKSFDLIKLPIFFFPAGYYFSFIVPYFFMTVYLGKRGIILNNPSIVFNLLSVDAIVIDMSISSFLSVNKEELEIFIKKLQSLGLKVVLIITKNILDMVKDINDVDCFINVDVSEKHSIVLKYQVLGYKVMGISEGFGNLGLVAVSDVGINMVENFDIVSKISDAIFVKKDMNLIFSFLNSLRKIFKIYRQNLYLSIFAVLFIYIFINKTFYSLLISMITSVFIVFLNSFRIYLKD
jgi:cation transport ATPase